MALARVGMSGQPGGAACAHGGEGGPVGMARELRPWFCGGAGGRAQEEQGVGLGLEDGAEGQLACHGRDVLGLGEAGAGTQVGRDAGGVEDGAAAGALGELDNPAARGPGGCVENDQRGPGFVGVDKFLGAEELLREGGDEGRAIASARGGSPQDRVEIVIDAARCGWGLARGFGR
jgi:hypothetical protein